METRGWLYGLIIFLAQTCNPYYDASNDYSSRSPEVHITDIEEAIIEVAPPPPPTVAPSPSSEIFKIVEEMPRFPGCEDKGLAKRELKRCAEKEMLKFISENVKYPELARENGIQGRVILRFVVNKKGKVVNAKVLRELGNGCGREALRVVNMMPTWIAGKQRGENVAVYYTLPVSFKL